MNSKVAVRYGGTIKGMDTPTHPRDDPHTPTMNKPENDNEMLTHGRELDNRIDRLTEEINILRLEGTAFCLDPREAKRRTGDLTRTVTIRNGSKTYTLPVTVSIHPRYGQPSVLAYKILQATFLKMTEAQYPYSDTVSFSQRELGRLVGRKNWGGKDARQVYEAMMQLHRTSIQCSLLDKDTKEFVEANFYIFPYALFAGKKSGTDRTITSCVVRVDKCIVDSLNKHHVAHFDLRHLDTLETIGCVLYKRLFFHLSNRWHPNKKKREDLCYEKDYADLCREWLGGLKPEKYKSLILSNQLGRHLDAIKRTGLLRDYAVETKASGKGFKVVFFPGASFFESYDRFYRGRIDPKIPASQSWTVREIQQPMELVARFHEALGHVNHVFLESETGYASTLLSTLSVADVNDLIDFAIVRAEETGFAKKMETFNSLKLYLGRWQSDRDARNAQRKRQSAMDSCPLGCKGNGGMLTVKDRTGAFRMLQCPHDTEALAAFETRTGLEHV